MRFKDITKLFLRKQGMQFTMNTILTIIIVVILISVFVIWIIPGIFSAAKKILISTFGGG